MSLRDDIETLMRALSRFGRASECDNTSRLWDDGNDSGDDEQPNPGAVDGQRTQNVCYREEPTRNMDVDISAIPLAAEGDELCDNATPVVKQAALSRSCAQEACDDTFAAPPPSGNTTALPCASGSVSPCTRLTGSLCTCLPEPMKGEMSFDNCRITVRETNETCQQKFPVGVDRRTSQYRDMMLNTTSDSSGNGTVPADLPEKGLHQMEEAYKRVARRLLAEIQRLDAHNTAISVHCEGERQNWLRVRRELENQLVDRDMLIGTLRRQLQKLQRVREGAPVVGPRLGGGSEWTLDRQEENERRTGVHVHNCPVLSSDACGISSSSAAETCFRPAPRGGVPVGNEKKRAISAAGRGSSGADTVATRLHPLREFLQRRLSSWGTSRVSDEVALQTSRATSQNVEKPGILKETTEDFSARAVGTVSESVKVDSVCQVRNTDPDLADPHVHEKHVLCLDTNDGQYKRQQNRGQSKVSASLFSLREKCARRRHTREETRHQHPSCRMCCRGQSVVTAPIAVPVSAARREKSGGNCAAVTRRGRRGTSLVNRGDRAASLTRRRPKWGEERRENRAILGELMMKNTLMEACLRGFQERLDRQEGELDDVVSFLRELVPSLAAESRRAFPGVSAS